jgi:N-methylhydantoinase A/oxoprolinase/acetone carboxylase beta subunit
VLDDLDWDELNQLYKELEERGTTQLVEAGVDPNQIMVSRTADMRMEGQFHEISVPLQNGAFGPGKLESMKKAFVDEYRRLYSHIFEGNPIMALTWRVRLAGPKPKISLAKNEAADSGGKGDGRQAFKGIRKAYFLEVGDFSDVNVYDRYLLQSNDRIPGPAIFEERESTAVIAPGDVANVDDYLNLVVSIANGDITS